MVINLDLSCKLRWDGLPCGYKSSKAIARHNDEPVEFPEFYCPTCMSKHTQLSLLQIDDMRVENA